MAKRDAHHLRHYRPHRGAPRLRRVYDDGSVVELYNSADEVVTPLTPGDNSDDGDGTGTDNGSGSDNPGGGGNGGGDDLGE